MPGVWTAAGIDLLNHGGTAANVTLSLSRSNWAGAGDDSASLSVSVVTTRDVAAGEQLLWTYGNTRCNDDFLTGEGASSRPGGQSATGQARRAPVGACMPSDRWHASPTRPRPHPRPGRPAAHGFVLPDSKYEDVVLFQDIPAAARWWAEECGASWIEGDDMQHLVALAGGCLLPPPPPRGRARAPSPALPKPAPGAAPLRSRCLRPWPTGLQLPFHRD